MAGSVNKVILIGNLGKDPEIRVAQNSGNEVATLSVATSDSWKDRNTGERREKTEWHKVIVFSPQLVQILKNYAKKGSKVYVEGSLQTRKWLSQDNIERYVTEITVQSYNSSITILDSHGEGRGDSRGDTSSASHSNEGDRKNSSQPLTYDVNELNDEIPF